MLLRFGGKCSLVHVTNVSTEIIIETFVALASVPAKIASKLKDIDFLPGVLSNVSTEDSTLTLA